ncbi:MAG: 4-hydroxybutyryl-CoA dehydratase, partial [Nitrososphaeria archaeon]|nr:4-hydroxybutyryl-CoA dehydratase [Nitrososphaeria archaeon]NIQ32397.1 4-hydroxybutyryl-CoA dehydratase [Nitrososphaeria archaeon]
MTLKTPEEYVESLKKLKPNMYISDEKVSDITTHPLLKPAVNTLKLSYELAMKPEYEDLMTAKSQLTGEKVNRFNHICRSC